MQGAFAAGDVWIAYAWPADWAAMKTKRLKVPYVHPKREPCPGSACSCSVRTRRELSTRTDSSTPGARRQIGNWLKDNYSYGHANTNVPAEVEALRTRAEA